MNSITEHLVLIFAYHFPPENAIGGARPFRFSKYLSRLGYSCRVFTAANQAGRDDPNTEYVPDPFVTRHRRSLSWQLERAVRKVFLPGELGTQWSYHAARAARAYIRNHPSAHTTIISTYPPLGAHFAASQLASSEGVPWLADFRDPMRDEDTIEGLNFRRRLYQWLERVLMWRANAVIANTDAAMARWREKFPALTERIHLIWNGFDPEERIQPLPIPPRDHGLLTHVGELYSRRSATPILESIARLIAANRLPSRSVRVMLRGPAQTNCLPNSEFILRARSQGWLDLGTEQIPQREASQLAQTSDGLLLLQPHTSLHVPAKIFEYLQIGRPILAFIQPRSPAERLLEGSGVPYRCVYPGSTPEAIDDTVADFFGLPSTAVAPSPWFEEQFNAANQTRMLHGIIRSLHTRSRALSSSVSLARDI
jgi:glycosyltransferase involved in cell wall biosynthesis